MNLFDMRFKVAVLGNPKANTDFIFKNKVFELISQMKKNLDKYNKEEYGFNQKEAMIDFYSCPVFAGEIWGEICSGNQTTLNLIIPNEEYEKNSLLEEAFSVTNLNAEIHNMGTTRSMIKWMINQIDIAILTWDGREYSNEGYIWNFMEECKHAHIPCIWLDKNDCENIYWLDNFHHNKYEDEYLSKYLSDVYKYDVSILNLPEKNIVFSKLWGICYNNFVNKNKIATGSIENAEDYLIKKDYELISDNEKKKLNYSNLKMAFFNYDEMALNLAKYYRESIYFRSILPFIATLFLAMGFYTETLIYFLFVPSDRFHFPIISIVAGIGFLIQAGINCYGYYMDEEKNNAVKKRKEAFLNCRYTAEYIRNIIHFLPFGIPVKYTHLNSYNLNNKNFTEEAKANIQNIIRSIQPNSYNLLQNDYQFVLEQILNMIESQISYHTFKKNQMKKISDHLKRIRDFIFWMGFIIVLLRGCLQFTIAFVDKSIWITRNGVSLKAFVSSGANMLALLIPGWYMYFSNKLSMNNFKGLTDHSSDAIESLNELKKKIENIVIQNNISYEVVSSLSEDIILHQIAELNDWYAQTMSNKITKL